MEFDFIGGVDYEKVWGVLELFAWGKNESQRLILKPKDFTFAFTVLEE